MQYLIENTELVFETKDAAIEAARQLPNGVWFVSGPDGREARVVNNHQARANYLLMSPEQRAFADGFGG